ncbi:UNKNOWN [Stylonychia lemnae]|uniref:Methyltransferase domain-containing protein n=1 Tax=Stylonychia lemnae TaxID=5949 RepID=A0A077ZP92_STYLE|nr:UNKNOWN [Stylonychia lemnae]|eukprot:CDW71205.1 UNKNOWN [Stylonychia lemnae]
MNYPRELFVPSSSYQKQRNKKDHEASRMADFLNQNIQDSSTVIDVGCGKGYVSLELADLYVKRQSENKLNIIMVDGQQNNIQSLKQEFEKREKLNGQIHTELHTKWINLLNYKDVIPDLGQKNQITITGIHQCGNLSSLSIHEFCKNANVNQLAIIGCCYNCLTERMNYEMIKSSQIFQQYTNSLQVDEGSGRLWDDQFVECKLEQEINPELVFGFPISRHVWQQMNLSQLFLGRSVRNAATVSLKSQKLLKNFDDTITKLFYRAAYEAIIQDKNAISTLQGEEESNSLKQKSYDCGGQVHKRRRIKKIKELDFKEYVEQINLVNSYQIDMDKIQSEFDKNYKPLRKKFEIIYILKALLSPLTESLIVLDRLIYIQEQGYSDSKIIEIFEKQLSTRNYLIYAKKPSSKLVL